MKSRQNYKIVFQGEAAITSSTSTIAALKSFAALTCVIITLYNPITKKSALVHIDEMIDIHHMFFYLSKRLSKGADDKLLVELASSACSDFLTKIKSFVEASENMTLNNIHFNHALMIDAKTGRTSNTLRLSEAEIKSIKESFIPVKNRIINNAELFKKTNQQIPVHIVFDSEYFCLRKNFNIFRNNFTYNTVFRNPSNSIYDVDSKQKMALE